MDGWSSNKIAVTIRMYPRGRYNARVYHQRCKGCNWVFRPQLDDSYAERVTYWLLKWNGVDVQAPSHGGRSNAPHNSVLCEGCKAGHCNG
ncbi:zinc-binding domain-containing protein [Aspergillus aurantiobrunneus]